MFERFGEFDSAEELNKTAEGLKKEGDIESLKVLAEENGLEVEDAEDYAKGAFPEFVNVKSAALGKIEAECRELNPKEIIADWVEYIRAECLWSKEMAAAVRKKGKSLKGCIAKLLVWSFKNSYEVDKEILKEAKVSQHCKMGIPGMAQAKQMIREYYMG